MGELGMDRNRGIKVGISVAVLAIAGWMFYRNWGALTGHFPDGTITSWTEDHTIAINRQQPVGPNNVDPRSTRVTAFADATGQVDLIEYPFDPNRQNHLTIEVQEGRRQAKQTNPMEDVAKMVSDPVKRVLTFAVVQNMGRLPWALRQVDLTKVQTDGEKTARESLRDQIAMLSTTAEDGTLAPTLHKQLQATLAAYRADAGNIKSDAKKQALAKQIIELSRAYVKQEKTARTQAILAYVNSIYGQLTSDQQSKLTQVAQAFDARLNRRNRAG